MQMPDSERPLFSHGDYSTSLFLQLQNVTHNWLMSSDLYSLETDSKAAVFIIIQLIAAFLCMHTDPKHTNIQRTHTFLILLAYCFMAIFSTVLSKPKKDLMSRLAVCSKHVQSSFSGWTCADTSRTFRSHTHTQTWAEIRWQAWRANCTHIYSASLESDAGGSRMLGEWRFHTLHGCVSVCASTGTKHTSGFDLYKKNVWAGTLFYLLPAVSLQHGIRRGAEKKKTWTSA